MSRPGRFRGRRHPGVIPTPAGAVRVGHAVVRTVPPGWDPRPRWFQLLRRVK